MSPRQAETTTAKNMMRRHNHPKIIKVHAHGPQADANNNSRSHAKHRSARRNRNFEQQPHNDGYEKEPMLLGRAQICGNNNNNYTHTSASSVRMLIGAKTVAQFQTRDAVTVSTEKTHVYDSYGACCHHKLCNLTQREIASGEVNLQHG